MRSHCPLPASPRLPDVATIPAVRMEDLSQRARARVRAPRTRGRFAPIDGARRQLALLEVADADGQAAASWLVDLPTRTIADSRFLAFGSLASHAVADVFTESVRGRSVDDAAALGAEQLDALLRDDPQTPAFGRHGLAPLAFVRDLQERALAAVPGLSVLPPPPEDQRYQRKRKADWTAADQAWLPLSLLAKIGRVDAAARTALQALAPGATMEIEALNDDVRIVARIDGVDPAARATLALAVQDRLRTDLHPELRVEVA